jgi:hypothetical protein
MNNDNWSDNQNEMIPSGEAGLSDAMIAQMIHGNDG